VCFNVISAMPVMNAGGVSVLLQTAAPASSLSYSAMFADVDPRRIAENIFRAVSTVPDTVCPETTSV